MAKAEDGKKRAHKATYAKDKHTGGYLVRVHGPQATQFAGRVVPVSKMDGTESEETLSSLVWAGVDTGFNDRPGDGKPVALYKFEAKPKDLKEAEF
jgi:hypothetical protein